MIPEALFFYFFAGSAVAAAITMLTRKTALGAAISLVVCFLAFSGIYAMLDAPFIAVMQVVVYAGAIMMLIVFVIMTVDTDKEMLKKERPTIIGALIATIIVSAGLAVYQLSLPTAEVLTHEGARTIGTVAAVGRLLFTRHVLNFEMLSLLLLVALAGALILVKQQKKQPGK